MASTTFCWLPPDNPRTAASCRGVDVGAKVEIYRLINDLAAAGKVVVMVSSDLPEVLGMADRIVVMHDGRITGRIDDVAAATQESIMEAAVA